MIDPDTAEHDAAAERAAAKHDAATPTALHLLDAAAALVRDALDIDGLERGAHTDDMVQALDAITRAERHLAPEGDA